jgi:putative addiction module killer protein
MRIHTGPGYRVYFVQKKQVILLLLCGGSKAGQTRDIARGKKIAQELKDDDNG